MLPDGELIIEIESNRSTISALKKVGLNLVVLPNEALHTLKDGVITELRAHEKYSLNVISE